MKWDKCPECGKSFSDKDTFTECPKCGTDLRSPAATGQVISAPIAAPPTVTQVAGAVTTPTGTPAAPVAQPSIERDKPAAPSPQNEEYWYTETCSFLQLSQFIFTIVLGLAFQRFAQTKLFSSQSEMAFVENVALRAPLVVLYVWTMLHGVCWLNAIGRESPISITFCRQKLGIVYLSITVVIGFVFFQIFDATTPILEKATTPVLAKANEEVVSCAVDATMWWMGILILFDVFGQLHFRRAIMEACANHMSQTTSWWREQVPAFRYYYGSRLPIKYLGFAVFYLVLFFPVPVVSKSWRYPLLSMFGMDCPLLIALGFAVCGVLFEVYLGCARRPILEVRAQYLKWREGQKRTS